MAVARDRQSELLGRALRSGASGSVTAKQVPPSVEVRLPPWASAIWRATVSPRPIPSGLPVLNGSNSRSAIVRRAGRARCRRSAQSTSAPRCDSTMRTLPPRASRFDGVEHQVQEQLPQLLLIGRQPDVPSAGVDRAVRPGDAGRPAPTSCTSSSIDPAEVAVAAAGRLRAAGGQKALADVLRSASVAAARRPGFPGRRRGNGAGELHGDPGAGDVVAQVMARPPLNWPSSVKPFRTFDHALHFVELTGQGVHRTGQVAQLVVAGRQRKGSKSPWAMRPTCRRSSTIGRLKRPAIANGQQRHQHQAPRRRRPAEDRPPASGRRARLRSGYKVQHRRPAPSSWARARGRRESNARPRRSSCGRAPISPTLWSQPTGGNASAAANWPLALDCPSVKTNSAPDNPCACRKTASVSGNWRRPTSGPRRASGARFAGTIDGPPDRR